MLRLSSRNAGLVNVPALQKFSAFPVLLTRSACGGLRPNPSVDGKTDVFVHPSRQLNGNICLMQLRSALT